MNKQHRGSVNKRRGDGDDVGASPRRLLAAVAKARQPLAGERDGCAAALSRFSDALDRVRSIPITLTLEEACLLVGQGVEVQHFAATALESLAAELVAMAGDGVDESPVLMGLAERAKFAARVERMLSAPKS